MPLPGEQDLCPMYTGQMSYFSRICRKKLLWKSLLEVTRGEYGSSVCGSHIQNIPPSCSDQVINAHV